jgi:hypothetical protein
MASQSSASGGSQDDRNLVQCGIMAEQHSFQDLQIILMGLQIDWSWLGYVTAEPKNLCLLVFKIFGYIHSRRTISKVPASKVPAAKAHF